MTIDADAFRSDAVRNMTAHLAGPLSAGARESAITLNATGVGVVPGPIRNPLLLVVLTIDLAETDRAVDVTVGAAAPVRLRFAPYSERGATLGIPIPAATGATTVRVTPAANIALRLVEGVLGRLLYTSGVEKVRLRRVAREIAAGRRLAAARSDGLDRLGVELAVPRFNVQLVFSPTEKMMIAVPGREADAAYRTRLGLYRPQAHPTRSDLEAALPALMARVGYTGRFTIAEADTELALAIRVISPPNDARRVAYLAYLRRQFLLPVDATELPANRPVSIAERTRAAALLTRLKANTIWPAGSNIAPPLAAAIDRAARCAAALGAAGKLEVTKAQRDDGGSRYELGIGADLRAFDAAVAQQMANALRSATFTGNPDAETRLLLSKMTPENAATDNVARWLFRGCGLCTAHLVAAGALFVSHLPVQGATLDVVAGPTSLDLTAVFHAEDPNGAIDANLAGALASAVDNPAIWSASPLSAVAAAAPPPAAALTVFSATRLTTPTDAGAIARAIAALNALPPELVAVLKGDATTSANVVAGNANGKAAVQTIVDRLGAGGAVSVLPLVAGGAVFLVVAMIDLPGNATVFNRRRAHFRWLTIALEADPRIGSLDQPRGARNRYQFAGGANASQVAAIVAATPTRPVPRALERRVEPYTVAIDFADNQQPLLSFGQQEYLMNLLDRLRPLGITIDTSRLRARGVDLDGDGVADPLPLPLQRTFRRYRGRGAPGGRT